MIRDPSDGSVKPMTGESPAIKRPSSEDNWGLKSLDQPVRKPSPAPTKEQLEAHYREFGLGFQRKEEGESNV